MGVFSYTFVLVVAASAPCNAVEVTVQTQANPIRRVVTMLQNMEKSVIKEGETEKALYDKYMCYCKNSGTDLADSIANSEDKLDTLPKEIEEMEDKLKATKEALKKAQTDRAAAKQAIAEATAIREKEAAAFAKAKAEMDANIGAIKKAVAALEAGMSGSFLQTGAAQLLRRLVADSQDMQDEDRETLSAFLQNKDGYAPQSGAITGILKQMGDEFQKALDEATAAEEAAIKDYEGMMAAKKKEIEALTKSIEKKIKEVGDMGVALVQMKDDLEDTAGSLADDKKFLADLEKNCKTKSAEWEKICEARNQELQALADTIKILNDDDALELFKKTLPAPSASFVQVQVTAAAMRERALEAVRKAAAASQQNRVELDLIEMALHGGKKIDFSKVIQMIDNMVALLKKEQGDDDDKKEYCETEFDLADDKKKALEKGLKDANAAIATAKKGIETTTAEIAELAAGIKKLDAEVVESTEQRQEENKEYKALIAADTATKELLKFAKNRLNKFYNPKLYKPPAKKELSAEGRIADSFKFAQVNKHAAAPPPPPEAPGPFKKKSEESSGVIAMIDLLIADMDKEMTEADAEEKDAQGDYEQFIADSKEKRRADTKSMDDKEKAKADMEAELEAQTTVAKDTTKELYATLKYIDSLHKECDFLLDFYEVRKTARTTEIKSLVDAKAVLSGADFSLIQTASRGFLHRSQ